jgi:hypothetical protein
MTSHQSKLGGPELADEHPAPVHVPPPEEVDPRELDALVAGEL